MSGEKEPLPMKEWLDVKIEATIKEEGAITAQYRTEKDKGAYGMQGPYSWFTYLVQELLQTYRVLKDHERRIQDTFDTNRLRWRKLLGLPADAETEQVEARLSQMWNYQGRFLKLLGLQPDATEQEITEAIDDVAPVFAQYRHKKRGT